MARVIDAVMRLKDQFSPTLKQISKNIEEQQRANERLTRSIRNTGKSMYSLGEAMLPVAAGITGVAAYGVKAFSDFEYAMLSVKGKMGGTEAEFKALTEQARQLSLVSAYSAKEVAEGMDFMAAAGWKANDIMAATPALLNMATAAQVDLATAADVLTNNMTAFGLSADKAGEFSDKLTLTANATNTSIPLMGESLKYVASVAKAAGTSFDEVSTAIGLMSNSGIKGSEAGTALRGAMVRMLAPPKAAADVIDQLNMTLTDSEGKFVGIRSAIDQFAKATENMGSAQKTALASQLWGQEAMAGMLALVNQGTGAWDDLAQQIAESGGTSADVAAMMNTSVINVLKITMNNLTDLAMTIGEKLKPTLIEFTSFIMYISAAIKGMNPETVDMVIKIAAVVVGLTAFLLIGGKSIMMVANIAKTFNMAALAVTKAGGIINLVTGVMSKFASSIMVIGRALTVLFMNPVGLAVLAIIALAVAIYTYWEPIKAFFISLWNGIVNAFSTAITAIKTWMDKTGITEKLQTLMPKIATFVAVCISLFMRLKNAVIAIFMAIASPVISLISTVWNVIIGKTIAGGSIIATILKVISTSFNIMVNIVGVYLNGFLDVIGIVVGGLISVFSGVITFLTGVFTGNWTMVWQGIVEIFSGIFSTIEGICNTVMSTIKAAINEVIAGVNSVSVDVPEWVPVVGGQHYQPQIPMLAQGTDNWRGGKAMIHDAGAEIVDLPTGSRVIPHDKSMQAEYARGKADGSGQGKVSIVIHVAKLIVREEADIKRVAKELAQEIENYAMNKPEGAV
ncbi:phage tail tape measure protein [Anaerosinus massiliensis]|uniref:phage tail tape measure protein n=1 Tax=Massilibacillus massiliensis TaxID=1806837 RepID=UPI000DA5EF90|nr:phage tail tape measure protein [Massilibacillus massiliensis]